MIANIDPISRNGRGSEWLLMVTGGYDGSKRLDSIEIYRVNVWTVSGQLPDATWVLKGITINNRVMVRIIFICVDFYINYFEYF